MDASIEQNIMDVFFAYLNAEPVYDKGMEVMLWVSGVVAPVMLFLALAVRAGSDTLNSISGKTNWLDTLRDLILGVLCWGIYIGLMNAVVEFFDVIDSAIGKTGAYSNLFNSMSDLVASAEESGISVGDLLSTPSLIIAYAFFFLSYLANLAVFAFLNICHAVLFCVCFIWGIIAISVSLSKHANLMRGWAIMMFTVLAWPIVEGVLFLLAGAMIENAAQEISRFMMMEGASSEFGAKTFLYALWGVLNCITIALAFSAPLITSALISNSGSISGAVASFGGAGLASAWGMFKMASVGSSKATEAGMSAAANIPGQLGSLASSLPSMMPQSNNPKPNVSSPKSDDSKESAHGAPQKNAGNQGSTSHGPKTESASMGQQGQANQAGSSPSPSSSTSPPKPSTTDSASQSSSSASASENASFSEEHQSPPPEPNVQAPLKSEQVNAEAGADDKPVDQKNREQLKKIKQRQQRKGVMINRQKKPN